VQFENRNAIAYAAAGAIGAPEARAFAVLSLLPCPNRPVGDYAVPTGFLLRTFVRALDMRRLLTSWIGRMSID
jgi:hypothetical protein